MDHDSAVAEALRCIEPTYLAYKEACHVCTWKSSDFVLNAATGHLPSYPIGLTRMFVRTSGLTVQGN